MKRDPGVEEDLGSPLNQITNEDASNRSPPGSHQENPQKSVRRTKSRRSLRRQLVSSDSIPEDDSIYNAERVPSSEDVSQEEEATVGNTRQAAPVLSRPLSSRSPKEASISHSRWQSPQLNTIIEQNSVNSLRTSRSLPRLKASPERTSHIVQPQTSIHSIHPKQVAPWPLRPALPSVHLYRRRSLSMPDLGCISEPSGTKEQSPHSSSSNDALEVPAAYPTYPNKPINPPPYRVPTPPGLPSFGTEEATEYRLRQEPPLRRIWNRIWQHSHEESDEPQTASPQSLSSQSLASNQPSSPPGEVFRRTLAMIGMARVVSPPPASSAGPRAPLPSGVYTMNTPGVLARADDGTYMRGRFGPRASGHGVGGRHLDSHPLARSSGTEEEIRQIDKACDRPDMESAMSQSIENGSRGQAVLSSPSEQGSLNVSQLERFRQRFPTEERGSEQSPSIMLSPPTGSTSPLGSEEAIEQELRNITQHMRPGNNFMTPPPRWHDTAPPSSPPMQSGGMRYGPGYTPSTILSLRSLDSTSQVAEDPERIRAREMVLDEQRRQQRKFWNRAGERLEDCCYEICACTYLSQYLHGQRREERPWNSNRWIE
ncbi:hypothetical protein LTR41_007087 [Exophiala xenobiotica]|nr:hypothetical protein LTR41_007087 [Exophiala xenobiotica]